MKKDEKPTMHVMSGRIRIKNAPEIRDPKTAALAEKELSSLFGVKSVKLNSKAGSILLRFDSRKVEPDALLEKIRKTESLPSLRGDESQAKAPESNGTLNSKSSKKKSAVQMAAELLGVGAAESLRLFPGFSGASRGQQLPERIRLKLKELKRNPDLARKLEQVLPSLDEIRWAMARPLTGTLVVQFEAGKLATEKLLQTLKLEGCTSAGEESIEKIAAARKDSRVVPLKILKGLARKAARLAAKRTVKRLFGSEPIKPKQTE